MALVEGIHVVVSANLVLVIILAILVWHELLRERLRMIRIELRIMVIVLRLLLLSRCLLFLIFLKEVAEYIYFTPVEARLLGVKLVHLIVGLATHIATHIFLLLRVNFVDAQLCSAELVACHCEFADVRVVIQDKFELITNQLLDSLLLKTAPLCELEQA